MEEVTGFVPSWH